MANGHENLIPASKRSKAEAKENGRKGGIASGEARRKKKDMRERAKLIMEMDAAPHVAKAMSKTGIDVSDNTDVVLAGIYKGVLKGETKSINLWMELTGDSLKEAHREELHELERRKAEAEAELKEMEAELAKMRIAAIKGIDDEEVPDDGFLDALKGTAAEDWSNDVL